MYHPIETYRGVVYPWSIDQVGHMNVSSYTARFDEASWQFLGTLGLTPSFLKKNERAAVAAEQRVHYLRELTAGSLVHITTTLIDIGEKSIRMIHRMYDSENDAEVAVMELVGVYFDIRLRKPAELPAAIHDHASKLFAGYSDDTTRHEPWMAGAERRG